LQIDNENHKTESGQISEFIDLSAQVELAGQKSNYFDEDLKNPESLIHKKKRLYFM